MKKKLMRYDYGECEICDSPLQEKLINQDFWIRGELIVVKGVPAGVCPRCGEKVVKADVGRWIAKAPRITVPTIRFETEEARV